MKTIIENEKFQITKVNPKGVIFFPPVTELSRKQVKEIWKKLKELK